MRARSSVGRGARIDRASARQIFKSPEALETAARGAISTPWSWWRIGLILPAGALKLPGSGLPQHSCLAAAALARSRADSARAACRRRDDRRHHHAHGGRALDTGPMLAARAVAIGARDTAKTLHDRLALLGAELMSETLRALRRWRWSAKSPQPAEGVTYAEKIDKTEALIDWRTDAAQIARQVRAFNPWPVAETRFNGAQLRIWDAETVRVARLRSADRREPCRAQRCRGRRERHRCGLRHAACCEFYGCSSPVANRCRPGISCTDSALVRRALRASMKGAAASARSLAAHAVARVLREGVTLDAALKDALVAAPTQLAPSVRSLSYGAVRGYFRHEAILGRLLVDAGAIVGFPGARASVGRAVRDRG